MKLHFDGFYEFEKIVESYGYVNRPSGVIVDEIKWYRAHVWCRITIFVQSILLTCTTCVRQVVRGCVFLFSGDPLFAVTDFVSVIIQALVLPILGIIATVKPGTAMETAKRVAVKFNPDVVSVGNAWAIQQRANLGERRCSNVTVWLGKITSPVQLALRYLQTALSKVLNPLEAGDVLYLFGAILLPVHIVKAFLSDEYQDAQGFVYG